MFDQTALKKRKQFTRNADSQMLVLSRISGNAQIPVLFAHQKNEWR